MEQENSLKILDDGKVEIDHQISKPTKEVFYWHEIKKYVYIFIFLEIATYFLSLIRGFEYFASEILTGFVFLLELVSIIILTLKFLKAKDIKNSFLVPAFFVLITFGIVSIFKFFWYFKAWTVVNLLIEPAVLVLWSLFFSLVLNIIYAIINKIAAVFNFYKTKAKKDLNI